MKRAWMIVCVLVLVSFLAGCCDERGDISTRKFFGEARPMRHVIQTTSQNGSLDGAFFLFAGAVSGRTSTQSIVKFSWKNSDDTWIISSIPMERVRVKLQPNATTPTVSFGIYCHAPAGEGICPADDTLESDGPQAVIDGGYVQYVTFTCRPEDWPINLQMPLEPKS
jgi:hypothetical protein